MTRILVAGMALAVSACGLAQSPDVAIIADLRPTYTLRSGATSAFRWYDSLSRPSVVGLSFRLEPGYRGVVEQRLQRVDGDGDHEWLYQYYIEDPGIWRIGKQVLPFGSEALLRESIRALRFDTNLAIDAIPVRVAVFDAGGVGRTRGAMARLSSGPIGVSAALGNHLAISSGALTYTKRSDESLGAGRGYRIAYGLDGAFDVGPIMVAGEWVGLRRGETQTDRDEDVVLLRSTFDFTIPLQSKGEVYAAHSFGQRATYLGLGLSTPVAPRTTVEPFLRLRNGSFYDFAITVRVKL
ncbi:MAG: hypothetical protein ACK4XJ_00190 [Fimbriimonadaceae bacterium]